LYLIKKDLKDILGSKKRIIVCLIVLIIFIISTSLYTSNHEETSIKSVKLGVINEDDSSYSKLLIEYFKTSESFSSFISVKIGSQTEIKEEFNKGILDVYLSIPKGFANNLIVLNHLPIEVVINGADKNKAILIDNILRSYEKYIKAVEINCVALYDRMTIAGFHNEFINKKNMEISYDLIFTALGKENFFAYEGVGDYKNTSFIHYLVVAFLSTIVLYTTFYMGLFIRKEKDMGIYGRLYAAGVPVWIYLLEKLLVLFGLIVLLVLGLVLIAKILIGISISFLSLICFLSLVLTGIAFVIFINVFFKKTTDYLLTGNFLCLFYTILGGGLIPSMYLPDKMLQLAQFTPTYWMIKMMLLSESNLNTSIIYKNITLLSISTLILYLLSLLVYQKEVINHG
jgi:ABC-2 type transport system permease protein